MKQLLHELLCTQVGQRLRPLTIAIPRGLSHGTTITKGSCRLHDHVRLLDENSGRSVRM